MRRTSITTSTLLLLPAAVCALAVTNMGAAHSVVKKADASVKSYPQTVLASKPAGYWRLNEAKGSTAIDETKQNDGKYHGAVLLGQTGRSGKRSIKRCALMVRVPSLRFHRTKPLASRPVGKD